MWKVYILLLWNGAVQKTMTTFKTIYRSTFVQKMSTVAPVVYELWLIEVTYMILFVTSITDSASKMEIFKIF